MRSPNLLRSGDTIAIVSTARKVLKEELTPAIEMLKNWGLKVVLGKTIEVAESQFAGNDELRALDFQEILITELPPPD